VVLIGVFGDAIELERARRGAAALVERGDEAASILDLRIYLGIAYRSAPA
jgi:hypothetical protein